MNQPVNITVPFGLEARVAIEAADHNSFDGEMI